MSQVIDDRHEDWFRLVMEAIEKASGGRESILETISAELQGENPQT